MSFSRNAASYFPRPRPRSQTTMSMTAPTIRGGACIIGWGSESVQGGVGILLVSRGRDKGFRHIVGGLFVECWTFRARSYPTHRLNLVS